jgi:hypothetical protein
MWTSVSSCLLLAHHLAQALKKRRGQVVGFTVQPRPGRRGLHLSTFRLNVSTFPGIRRVPWVEVVTKAA